jgi:hypothetical protein
VGRGLEDERVVFEAVVDDVDVFLGVLELLAEHVTHREVPDPPTSSMYSR